MNVFDKDERGCLKGKHFRPPGLILTTNLRHILIRSLRTSSFSEYGYGKTIEKSHPCLDEKETHRKCQEHLLVS